MLCSYFHIMISGDYVTKPVCTSNELIDKRDECILAISQLNLHFGGDSYKSNRPKGCWHVLGGGTLSYWNSHSTGRTSVLAQSICKIGVV